MKKLLFSLFTALSFLSLSAQTQYVIDFESSFAGDSTLSSGGQTFGVTTVDDTYRVYNFTNGGWNGTTTDNKFLDNSGGGASSGNTTLQFGMLYGGNFTLQELYLYVSQSNINLAHTSGSVTFTGKLSGSTVFSFVKSTGFASPATKSPNNGFTLIDFATEGGSDYSSTLIDNIVISTTGDINYLAMDAFKWSIVTPVSVSITSNNSASCNGGSDGSLTATITPGVPNYNYSWSNGATTSNTSSTTNTITGLSSGTYTVTATDNNGTTATATAFISQPNALNGTATASSNVSCNGGSDGSASASASGGTSPYTYSWNTGSTSATSTNIPAGTYTVTITDNNGCTTSDNLTVSEPPVLTASIVNQLNVTSTGGNDGYAEAAGAGGTSPYTYVWSNGSPNQFLTFAAAGTYTVSVTDNNGCGPVTANAYISQPVGPVSVTISSVNHVSCNGGNDGNMSAIISPGQANYDYFWSNGVSDTNSSALFNTLSNLTTGTYTVTVVDDNGTSATAAAFISQPSLLQASNTSSSNVTCNGGSNGSATTGAVGGTSPYTYTWSSGDTSSTAVNLSAGTVTVTITDNNGCTAIQPFSITEPSAVLASISAQTNVSTFGASDGSATASGSGGTAPYTYTWSNSATTASIINVMAGTYTVSITDNIGCGPGTATATITQPACMQTADTVQAGTSTDVSSDNTRSPFTTAFEDARHQYIVYGSDLNAAGGCDGELAGMAFNVISASPMAINATIKLKHTTEIAFSDPNFETGGFTTVYSGTFTPSNGWYWIDFSTNFNWDGTSNILVEFCFDNSSFTSNSSLQVSSTFINTHRYAYANGTSGCSLSSNGMNAYVPNTRFRYPALTVSTTKTNVTCNGLSDGSISTSVGGGTMPYSYAWSNGDTLSSISGLAAGTYTLTVTDVNSVTGVAAITVTEPSQLSVTTSSTDVDCNGYSNGTVTATPSGGTAPYNYAWDSGDTSATSSSLPTGPWNVTVTDANGCTATGMATVSEPAALTAVSVVDSNITCNGFADGGATASATGGISPYTYLWSNSATTASITGVIAGTYTVTVTDNKGCTNTSTATITQPSTLSATATIGQNASCNGASDGIINSGATGGTAPYTYSWSNGATPASNTNLSAGTYTVTITDNNGCTDVSSATVTEPSAVNVNISAQTNVACNGSSTGSLTASASGGNSPYTYLWSNGSTTATINNLSAGSYTVTLSDANSCTDVISATINQFPALVLTVNETSMTCISSNTGVLTANPSGGAGSFSYLWSTGASTNSISGLAAGTYTVTVTDGNGCTIVASNSVNTFSSPIAQFNLNPQIGSSLPHTVFFTDQSTLPNTWFWDFGDGNTSTAQNPIHSYTSTGTHYVTLTVTDTSNGCQSTALDSVFISPVVVTVGLGSQVTCNGGSDGSLLATVSLGTTPLTYSWSNGASSVTSNTSMTLTNLAAGTYTVTVTDNSGATATASGTLTDPPVLSATTSTTAVSCNGGNNGTATATGTGGESPYTYVWSNGQTTGTTVSLAAGTYTVTLSDNRGCTTVANASVTEPAAVVPTLTVVQNVSCNGGADASINSSVVGGTAPYTYTWSNGSTTANVSSLVAGTYTVTITDNNGCTASNSATATEPTLLVPALVIDSNVSCNGFSNGGATASASGGTAPYTYLWSNASTTASITGVMAGTYTVTITDNKGCTASLSDVITEPTTLVAASVVDSNATCSGINNGGATASGTGGTMPYTYLWSNSAITASITGVAAGTYTVSLTDNNGCTASSTVTITEPVSLAPTTVVDSNVSCNGLSDGGATASATGGTMPYTYLWSNSATTASITGVSAGTYTVTITDNQGCTASSASTVTEPAILIAATLVDSNVSCNGLSDGGLTASATGGTVPYTYVWSNSATTATITGLPAGTYTVTVTDNNGCSNSNANTITEPTTLIASASLGSNVSCNGSNDGQANGSVTGGTSPYTYTWSNGGTMANATNLIAGTYTLTVTDANGCTDQASQVITEPTLLVSSASLDNNATCNNAPDGGATASAVGGTAPYTYTWSNATNTASITGVINGTYYVTITDANACTDSSSVVIGVSDVINPVAIANDTTLYLDASGQASVTANGIDNGSNDACGIQSLQLDITNFSCTDLGPNTVELLVVDVNGNRDSTTAVVTVLDTVSPVINSCPTNISVLNDASVCGAIVNWTLPGATDNCTVDSLVSNFNSGDLFPVGTTLVTYTAYDQSMNTSTCSFTITVTDNEKPTLVNVPANIVVSNDSASCDALVSWTAPTANDNCQVDSIRSNYQPGTVFPLGLTTVEYIAYDGSQNTDTVTFTITVNDTELPTIVCPADIAQCDSLVTFTAPVGLDNCAGAVTVRTDGLTLNSGDLFPVGVTTLSYQVTDASNNQATCSFDIEVYSPPQVNAGPDLSTRDIEPIQIQAVISNADSIQWSPFFYLNNGNIEKPLANPQETTTFTVDVISPDGCADSDDMTISVNVVNQLDATTLFTPNGDGRNDTWVVNKPSLVAGCKLVIFNRNGTEVYSTSNYQNDWDATISGKQLPEGTYYYIFDCPDGRTLNGPISVIREKR